MRIPFAAALLLAAAPLPAAACSVVDDYRVPTNLELAEGAQTILLGRVTGADAEGEDPIAGTLTIHPLKAIKGTMPDADLHIAGLVLASGETAYYGVLSNPYEFESAHPVSYIGACIRYFFPLGTTALFFLNQQDGEWRPSGGPFSRWAEDVPGPDAPWVRLTELYVRAAALGGEESKALLESERDGLRARMDDPVAQLMATDIERQLAGPNEPWNRIMQRELGLLGGDDDESNPAGLVQDAAEAAAAAMEDAAP